MNKLCLNCHKPLPAGKRKYCSSSCKYYYKKYYPIPRGAYVSGNNGGDYLHIFHAEEYGDNMLYLEIGSCCVMFAETIIPVEIITSILLHIIKRYGNIANAADEILEWDNDFKNKLIASIIDRPNINRMT